jgi:hypothetical protein
MTIGKISREAWGGSNRGNSKAVYTVPDGILIAIPV